MREWPTRLLASAASRLSHIGSGIAIFESFAPVLPSNFWGAFCVGTSEMQYRAGASASQAGFRRALVLIARHTRVWRRSSFWRLAPAPPICDSLAASPLSSSLACHYNLRHYDTQNYGVVVSHARSPRRRLSLSRFRRDNHTAQ